MIRRSLRLVIFCMLVVIAGPVNAVTRYVSPSGSASAPYTNWTMAAQDIQTAVDASVDGDVVLVTNGTYSTGARSMYGTMSNRVVVDKAVRVESVNGATFTAIQGGVGVRGVWLTNHASLIGFTVSNGSTISTGDFFIGRSGGNVWATSNGVVSNCVLVGGNANRGGGGIYGGRIYASQLKWNVSSDNGGAASASSLFSCFLYGNSTYQAGGAWGSKLLHCTVVSNTAQYAGGVDSSAVTNSIVYYNTASVNWNNILSSTVGYSCMTPLESGTGNFTNAPMLTSLADPHLLAISPCVETGTYHSYVDGLTDLDGQNRWGGVNLDVGCDEFYGGNTGVVTVSIVSWPSNLVVNNAGSFECTVGGLYDGFLWDFGDGTITPNNFNPSHSWTSSGTKTVILSASNVSMSVAYTGTVSVVAAGSVTYVSPFGGHVAPYTNWTTAATNIQAAIDACSPGGLVHVTNGTYATGGRLIYGSMSNRVVVDKSVSVVSENGPAVTFIQGGPGMRGVWLTNGAVLSGFTVTGGQTIATGDQLLERSGGNVWAMSNGVISNCILVAGTANRGGGGLYGGQIYSSKLRANSSGDNGGAASASSLYNCHLYGNSTYQAGGAWGSKLFNCTVVSNAAQYAGGVDSSAVTNSIIYYNVASVSWDNILNSTVSHSCMTPLESGDGNFTNAPGLTSLSDPHLLAGSACINAGTNHAYVSMTRDVDGDARLFGAKVDAGCDEFVYGGSTPVIAVLSPTLSFTGQIHGAIAGQTLVVSNAGDADINYTIASDVFWLGVTGTSGSLAPGQTASHSISVSTRGLDLRTYWGQLTISDPAATNSPQTVSVSLTLSPVALPTKIVAWGNNTIYPGDTNTPVDLTNAVELAVGGIHTLVRCSDGTVRAWGYNTYGQTNVPAGLTNIVTVASGTEFSLAVRANGTVVAWGDNSYGQLNVPTGLSNIVAVAAVGYHALALRSNGTVAAWGYNASGQTNVPSGLSNVVAIACGTEHSLALRANGTVVAWGNNGSGQTNVPTVLTNAVAVRGGWQHSMALRANGTVVAWGNNTWGQTNVPSDVTTAVELACRGDHSMALLANGSIRAWGTANGYSETNVPPGLTNVMSVVGQAFYSHALVPAQSLLVASDHGTAMPAPGTNWLTRGVAQSCSMTLAVTNGNTQYVCVGWIGTGSVPASGTSNTVSVTLTNNSSITWLWQTNFLTSTTYVSPSGGHLAPYSTWATAATTLQAAVDSCFEGGTVWVTNGTYSAGARAVYGAMSNRVVIDKAVCMQSVNGAAVTIIQGGTGIRGAWLTNGAALIGFTVTNGRTLSSGDNLLGQSGAGVWATSNGVVSNCVLVGGYATRGGGGIYGGRIYSSRLVWNASGDNGGAASASALYNCYLAGNSTYQAGGAWGSKLYSCTVVSNTAQYAGGVDNSVITNSIVYYNTASVNWSNTLNSSVGYTCTYPAEPGTGNFTNAPGIAALSDPHLVLGSPCVNAGINLGYVTETRDIDMEVRSQGAAVDVGCDEIAPMELVISSDHGSPSPAGVNFVPWNDLVTCSVDSVVLNGSTQYVGVGWTGTGSAPTSGTNNSVSFAMTNDATLTWLWQTNHWLTASAASGGSVSLTGAWYSVGASGVVTATPNPGYLFLGWSGDTNQATFNSSVITVGMPQSRTLAASFVQITNTLTVNSAYGIPIPTVGVHAYAWGSTQICSVPTPVINWITQYVCVGWTGTGDAPASGSSNSVTFTMTNSSTLTWLWQTNIVATGAISAELVTWVPDLLAGETGYYSGQVSGLYLGTRWDFDDGSSESNIWSVSHIWPSNGIKTVNFVAWNDETTVTASVTVTVGDLNLLRTSQGGQLLSFTSQINTNNSAAKLNDGVTGATSFWKSATNPVNPQVFLWQFTNGSLAQLNRAVIYNYGEGSAKRYSKSYCLELSTDGTNFTTVTNGVLTADEKARTNDLAGYEARWVRLSITNGYVTKFWELSELEVYGYLGEPGPLPEISITSPTNATSVPWPTSLVITAAASDLDGEIAAVTIYGDGSPLGTATTSPYQATWIAIPYGSHSVYATATDVDGFVVTSMPVTVSALQTPVNLLLNANGGQLLAYTSQLSTANAATELNDGVKGSSSFWKSMTNPVSPQGFVWQFTNAAIAQLDRAVIYNYGEGSANRYSKGYRLEVSTNGSDFTVITNGVLAANEKAVTNSLFGVEARWLRLVVTNGHVTKFWELSEVEVYGSIPPTGDPVPPTVTITAPASGSTNFLPAALAINVSAGDVNGVVTQVVVYGDGAVIGADATAPFDLAWSGMTQGVHQLRAVAYDSEGLVATSATLSVTAVYPVVNLLLQSNGGQLLAFTSQVSSANAATELNDGLKGSSSFWKSMTNPVAPQGFVWQFTNAAIAQLDRAVIYNYGEGSANRYSKSYRLDMSTDGTNYTLVTNGVLLANEKALTNSLAGLQARYIRLVVTNGYVTKFWELAEVEIYGALSDGGGGSNSFSTPEEMTGPTISQLTLLGVGMTLSFEPGPVAVYYSVDYKTQLSEPWTPIIEDQLSLGGTDSIDLPTTDRAGFYRIRTRPVE